jgi:hypothetical protein
MSDTQPDDQIDKEANPRSVEDNWQELLVEHTEDVDTETAEQIIRSLQSHPMLAFGDPSIQQTQTLIEGALDKIALTEYGVSASESERVKELMREELREGLAGNRIGPMSLTTPAHIQVESDIPPPLTADSADAPTLPENSTSSDDNDAEESPPAGDTDPMSVDPSEVETTGGGVAPGAIGAIPDAALRNQSFDASEASDLSQADIDIDVDEELTVFIARAVLGEMQQQHLPEDEELSERLQQVITKAAELGAHQHQQLIKTHLFGHLDENAQDIVFDQTMVEPIKDEIAQELKQMNK